MIEVADASLNFDCNEKLPAYGREAIPEVWILDLRGQTLEVFWEPHFSGHGSQRTLRAGVRVAPLAFPDAVVQVAEMFGRI